MIVAGGVMAAWWSSSPNATSPVTAPGANAPTVSAMHGDADRAAPTPPEQVIVPELSPLAANGKILYDAGCSVCHGVNAAGTDKGPPLIHNLYRPGHHGDGAFAQAANNGVTAHHWRFGNMPPIRGGVTQAEIRQIVKYIREMQEANGVR